ncbi:chorismate synthase [Diplocloster modestus]|uniref:Chorismate synthase n=1 Tax=Diplocloster modestus TaxID=2850322 RepID=A0ABS6KCG7_9FIRM|nr:chorismate synthase [Diplocloster modestus]MBU9728209.1 chorismate synthase [Diplocloster modestus]
MSGSTYGTVFKIATWGESHGNGIGVVVDGCPSGLALTEEDIQVYLDRRKPGTSKFATQRKEGDLVEIISGVFEGRTTGTPIAMLVRNTDQRSKDYSEIANYYRPGHADLNFDVKYGFRDYRGGGRSSGRETIARVAAGAVACKLLQTLGVTLTTYTKSIGPVDANPKCFDPEEIYRNPFHMPDPVAAGEAAAYLQECMHNQNSSGGVIECVIRNFPQGAGEPVFEKLDANLAKAIMSIGAVKGFEIGDGFAAARATGLDNNDPYGIDASGNIRKATNHAGGILGGISDGSDIIFRAAVKPTPSIAAPQMTVNRSQESQEICIKGRHDPVIVPRAVVVVESMAAVALIDMLFQSMTSRLDKITEFFK